MKKTATGHPWARLALPHTDRHPVVERLLADALDREDARIDRMKACGHLTTGRGPAVTRIVTKRRDGDVLVGAGTLARWRISTEVSNRRDLRMAPRNVKCLNRRLCEMRSTGVHGVTADRIIIDEVAR